MTREQSSEVHPGAHELVERVPGGRRFELRRRVSIDDADPDGRMELDAIARFLQDVGNDDTDDAGMAELGLAWVARRMTIEVTSAPVPRELVDMVTWCSGTGKRWAERRTSMRSPSGGRVEAATVWVHLDPHTGRPIPWGDEFAAIYLEATGGRRVDVKLRHAKTPPDGAGRPWRFRTTDMDGFGHVNNAAYLAIAEEFLSVAPPCRIEVEWRAPSTAGEELTVYRDQLDDGEQLWVVGPDDTLRATLVMSGA